MTMSPLKGSRQASFYSHSGDDVDGICEYTENNEGQMALDLILGAAIPDILAQLRERAYQVARLFAYESSEDEVKADVDAWIQWDPGSGVVPPYST